jgi:hypothetical protein
MSKILVVTGTLLEKLQSKWTENPQHFFKGDDLTSALYDGALPPRNLDAAHTFQAITDFGVHHFVCKSFNPFTFEIEIEITADNM